MHNYNDLKTWLSTTERNAFFFTNDESHRTLLTLVRDFAAAYRVLQPVISNAETTGKFTRGDYLEWVKLWKATYAKITYEIRMSKRGRKSSLASDSMARLNATNAAGLRDYASYLIGLRVRSKELAAHAYAKSKEAVDRVVELA